MDSPNGLAATRSLPRVRASPRIDETRALIAGAAVFALVIRVLFATRSGVWRDEAQFLWILRFPSMAEIIHFLRLHESHPPLFYAVTRAWGRIFGDSESAALALPILLGVALVPLTFAIGARLLSRRTALFAALLVAASPAAAQYSGQARPYSLMPLLGLLSVYYLWRGLSEGGWRPWSAYALATLALLLTHNWAWLVFGAEWVIVGLWLTISRERSALAIGREWLLIQATILMIFAPWASALLYQIRHGGQGVDPGSSRLRAFRVLAEAAVGIPESFPQEIGMALLAALAGVAIWQASRQRTRPFIGAVNRRLAVLLLTGIPVLAFVGAWVLITTTDLFFARCFVTLAPCVLLAIAHGIASLPCRERPFLPLALLLALLVASLAASVDLLAEVKSNARELAAQVAPKVQPSDLMVITPEVMASSFNYYFRPYNEQIDFPHEGRQGATPFDDRPQRLGDPVTLARVKARLAEARRAGRRVWLIMARDEVRKVRNTEVLPVPRIPTGTIGMIRSNQLRQYLTELYGVPDTTAVPPDSRIGIEILVAFRFEPGR